MKGIASIFRMPFLGFTELVVWLLVVLAVPPACGLVVANLSHQRVGLSTDLFLATCSFVVGFLYLLTILNGGSYRRV